MPSVGWRGPAVVFAAVEAGGLNPLPRKRFVLATWSRATVGPDIHIKAGRTLYSVPWRLSANTSTPVPRVDGADLRRGQLITTHAARARASRPTCDYPPEKIAFAMRNPAWCRRQAEKTGPATLRSSRN